MGKKKILYQPQGSVVPLYMDDGSTRDYETQSIHYKLFPTGVAVCTFNTPGSMNAISFNQRWEIFVLLEHMKRDDNVKVAIWTGSGDKAFNAGADLKFNNTMFVPEDVRNQYLARGMGVKEGDWVLTNETIAFWDFPKPSICAVNGMAIGGAANIALMNYHDIVICSENARFMYPFPKLGFIPELGSSMMLAAIVGPARAKEMFFLCDWFSGEKACQLGLANKVVKHEDLMKEAMEVAEKFVILPPEALTFGKKVVNEQFRCRLEQTLALEQKNFVEAMNKTGGPMKSAQYMQEKLAWLEEVKSKL